VPRAASSGVPGVQRSIGGVPQRLTEHEHGISGKTAQMANCRHGPLKPLRAQRDAADHQGSGRRGPDRPQLSRAGGAVYAYRTTDSSAFDPRIPSGLQATNPKPIAANSAANHITGGSLYGPPTRHCPGRGRHSRLAQRLRVQIDPGAIARTTRPPNASPELTHVDRGLAHTMRRTEQLMLEEGDEDGER
jgi:hypothetical protein